MFEIKYLAGAFIISCCVMANAREVSFLCHDNSSRDCLGRTVNALEKLGCNPVHQSAKCGDASTDPSYRDDMVGKDLCLIESDCYEPRYGLFGQISCDNEAVALSLKSVSKGITLSTSTGLFQRFVVTLCK